MSCALLGVGERGECVECQAAQGKGCMHPTHLVANDVVAALEGRSHLLPVFCKGVLDAIGVAVQVLVRHAAGLGGLVS